MILVIGPVDRVKDFLNLSRYDEHVIAWRWHIYTQNTWTSTYGLHVLDYYLHLATKELTSAQRQ